MRRAFPYILAAAAGAALFQLASARAQVDRRALQPEAAFRIYEGTSDRGDIREALDDATSRAVRDLPGADRQVQYRVRDITGETGGIRGAHTVRVAIEVTGDDLRLPLPRPRDPRDRDDPPPPDDPEDGRRGLRTEVRVPRSVERGEAVAIDFVIANLSDRVMRIPLEDSQKYEFEVLRDNRVVWRWSEGRNFSTTPGTTIIQPNEEVTYRVTWDQRNVDGVRVPGGTYQVRAFIPTTLESRVGNTATLNITGR
jgi:hypothetical protein